MANEWEGPTFSSFDGLVSLLARGCGRCELHLMQIATGVQWFAWFDVQYSDFWFRVIASRSNRWLASILGFLYMPCDINHTEIMSLTITPLVDQGMPYLEVPIGTSLKDVTPMASIHVHAPPR